jgi:hypothetical protein
MLILQTMGRALHSDKWPVNAIKLMESALKILCSNSLRMVMFSNTTIMRQPSPSRLKLLWFRSLCSCQKTKLVLTVNPPFHTWLKRYRCKESNLLSKVIYPPSSITSARIGALVEPSLPIFQQPHSAPMRNHVVKSMLPFLSLTYWDLN